MVLMVDKDDQEIKYVAASTMFLVTLAAFFSPLQGAVGPPGPNGPRGRRGPPGLHVSQCKRFCSPTYTLPLLHALQSHT